MIPGTFQSGSAQGMRFAQTKGRIQNNGMMGVNYPSPFFDVAHTYLPTTVKQMFRWCRYYFLTNPLINATVFKLSEYPVTDIFIDHAERGVSEMWSEYFQNHLRFRPFQVEVGLDYHVYGNAFVSISYPFTKFLKCPGCSFSAPAAKIRNKWAFSSGSFRLTCSKCGNTEEAYVEDVYLRNPSGVRLVRWNPEDIEITYNDLTGKYTYYYNIPNPVRNDILLGKKEAIENTPQVFLSAIQQNKGIIFSNTNLFHLRRPSLATTDRGWGTPLLLPVLKDTFYLQIMKKAQETLLLEHIVPLRVIFPQAASGTADPFTTVDLSMWKEHVAAEIARWRMDNNYIPILPLPIGNQTIGGDGRALLLSGEIQQWSEQIMAGMGVPREFLIGGLSYAGSNVSMRMLENAFIGYILRHREMARWIMQSISSFLRWPAASVRFKPFRMADDIQRMSLDLQLNQANKLSDTTLLSRLDYDQEEENSIMRKETASRLEAAKAQQLAQAQIQAEQQLVMMKAQMKAQQAAQQDQQAPVAPGEPGGPEVMGQGTPGGQEAAGTTEQAPQSMPQEMQSPLGEGQRMQPDQAGAVDLPTMAYMNAQAIAQMPPEQQQQALQSLYMQSPELGDMVAQMLQHMGVDVGGGETPPEGAPQVDDRPLPEQRPPRRANSTI